MRKRFFSVLILALGLALVGTVHADNKDNVREVQTKLRDGGFYFGQIDGAYSSALAAALTRYQIRNGLPITGQLDVDTSKALAAKPAVTTSKSDPAQTSEAWRQLRKPDEQFLANKNVRAKPAPGALPVYSPPAEGPSKTSASAADTERLRDYVAAFVLAGSIRRSAQKRISLPIACSTMTTASRIAKKSGRICSVTMRAGRRENSGWPAILRSSGRARTGCG